MHSLEIINDFGQSLQKPYEGQGSTIWVISGSGSELPVWSRVWTPDRLNLRIRHISPDESSYQCNNTKLYWGTWFTGPNYMSRRSGQPWSRKFITSVLTSVKFISIISSRILTICRYQKDWLRFIISFCLALEYAQMFSLWGDIRLASVWKGVLVPEFQSETFWAYFMLFQCTFIECWFAKKTSWSICFPSCLGGFSALTFTTFRKGFVLTRPSKRLVFVNFF